MSDPNANRSGYKGTKVGWIPEEWECHMFGDIVDLSEYGLSLKNSPDGNTPIAGMKHISDGRVVLVDCPSVKMDREDAERYFLRRDDLLFNRTNSLEHVGKLGIVRNDSDTVFASYLVRLRVSPAGSPAFIAAFFNLTDSRNKLKKLATPGVAQYNINATELKRQVFVPFPPLPEQQKIADILSTWDEAIEKTGVLIKAKQRQKKALMRELLTGKKRLPGFTKSSDKTTTRTGEIPADWKWVHLGEILKKRIERSGDTLPLMAITIDSGMIRRDSIDRKVDSELTPNDNLLVREGDIAYNTMRMWQGAVGVAEHDCHVSPAYVVCSPVSDSADPWFYYYWFKSAEGLHLLWSYSYGITGDRLRLYAADFAIVPAPLPSIAEQLSPARSA